jgi:hypothetical protein
MDPSRVTSLTTIWPLVACNLGMFLGRTLAGLAADLVGGCETLAFCLTTAGLLQVVVWHKATSFAGVMAFAVVFGMFGGAAMRYGVAGLPVGNASAVPDVVVFPSPQSHRPGHRSNMGSQ